MDSKSILIGLIAIIGILFFIWQKSKGATSDTQRPSEAKLPTQQKINDKIVVINDINAAEMHKIITDFCNIYNKENYQALPRLFQINDKDFAITFPFDINFDVFCFYINYIRYPMNFDKSFQVMGWATTKKGDSWIASKNANKSAVFYIPEDDTAHDNVFMTTNDNICYKLDFGSTKGEELLGNSKHKFVPSPLVSFNLENKEFVDFK
jgi:hypothetical protein